MDAGSEGRNRKRVFNWTHFGTSTGRASIIEAINGWMKEELALDFGLADMDNLPSLLVSYFYYFNNSVLP